MCNGGTTTVNVTATGGTAPYTGTGNYTVSAGNYSYTVTDANGCSSASATTSITVSQPTLLVVTSSAGSVSCSGGTTTLIITATGGTAPYNGDGSFTVGAGNYSNVVTDANGCSATAAGTVTTDPAPTVNSVSNQIVCSGSNTAAVVFSGAVSGTTFNWTNSNSSIGLSLNGTGDINSFVAVNSGTSAVTSTITVTPTNNGCNGSAVNFTITVNPSPVIQAGSNSPVCLGSSIDFTASTVTGAAYNWSGDGFTSSDQNPSISNATLVMAGTYTLTVTANGCTSAPSTVTVAVNDCGGSDLSVTKTVSNSHPIIGTTIVFTIVVTDNGPNDATGVVVTEMLQSGYSYVTSSVTAGSYDNTTGLWTIGNLNNGVSETLTVTVVVNAHGIYTNTATVVGTGSDFNPLNNTAVVEPTPETLSIPEGFSPNGDLVNDNFVIKGIENYPNNTFVIFNRWGDKVYEAHPYNNTWDGTATEGLRVGGNQLPIGTYFYVLDLGDGSPVYKGTIYLNR